MRRRITLIIGLALLGVSCNSEALHLKISFDDSRGIRSGDRVIFEQHTAGRVTGLTYSEKGTYVVDVEISGDFKNAATEHAAFYIAPDPEVEDRSAVEIIHRQKGGKPLKDGALIAGSTRPQPPLFLSLLTGRLEEIAGTLKNQFDALARDLGKLPDSKEFKELEKELDRLADELKSAGKSAPDKAIREMMSQLKKRTRKTAQKA